MIITMADVRAQTYCSRGSRAWFARHGLDWADFLANGIEAEALLATGDPMAIAIVEQAELKRGWE